MHWPSGRPLADNTHQPAFTVAAACSALGFGMMNLLLAATTLAMQPRSLPFIDMAPLVLE